MTHLNSLYDLLKNTPYMFVLNFLGSSAKSGTFQATTGKSKLKFLSASNRLGNRVVTKNSYLIEFASETNIKDYYQTVAKSLKASNDIDESAVIKRRVIESSLFIGVSITITVDHPVEALEMIEDAVAIYPVYTIRAPKPIKSRISSEKLTTNDTYMMNSHNLTGVFKVHQQFNNFGKGVRVRSYDRILKKQQ